MVFHVLFLVARCLMAVEPRSGSRWSARSAARTNDLDVDKVDRMLIGGGEQVEVSGHVLPPCADVCAVFGRAGAQPYLGPRTMLR